jgi:hypothetical protein
LAAFSNALSSSASTLRASGGMETRPTDSSTSRSAAAVAKRPSGDLASARSTISSIAGWTQPRGACADGGSGSFVRCAATTSIALAPTKGGRPVSAS